MHESNISLQSIPSKVCGNEECPVNNKTCGQKSKEERKTAVYDRPGCQSLTAWQLLPGHVDYTAA